MSAFEEFESDVGDLSPHRLLVARWRNAIVAPATDKHGHLKGRQPLIGIMPLPRLDLAASTHNTTRLVFSNLEPGERVGNQGLEFLWVGGLPGRITTSVT